MNNFVKYLLCIFFSILALNFIVTIFFFFSSLSTYLLPSKIAQNPTSETFISVGKDFEENLDNVIYELKEHHGEDYPALGIMYYRTVSHYSSVSNVQNLIFSLIAGFALGNIIFFMFILKAKSYKLVLLLILTLFITSIFLAISDILTSLANNEQIKFSLSEIFWNMELTSIPYIIVSLVLYFIQKVSSTFIEIRNS